MDCNGCSEGPLVELDSPVRVEVELEAQSILPADIHVFRSGWGVPCIMSHVFWLNWVFNLQILDGLSYTK